MAARLSRPPVVAARPSQPAPVLSSSRFKLIHRRDRARSARARRFSGVCLAMTRTYVFALLCVGLSAVPADAQMLTIAEGVDEAVRHNLSLIAQRANLTVADTQMLTARLRPNPVASLALCAISDRL